MRGSIFLEASTLTSQNEEKSGSSNDYGTTAIGKSKSEKVGEFGM